MNPGRRVRDLLLVAVFAVVAGGCATRPVAVPDPALAAKPEALSVLRSIKSDPALEERILALNPERIGEDDFRETLAKAPAPRIVLVHGGIFPVHLAMVSFGRFLTGMGYPEERIRHPGDRRWSHSPYEDSAQIAGLIAWYYEREGLRPLVIGHSQGGVEAVKVLYELAGRFTETIPVWNPYTDAAEDRTSIVDPLTGAERSVVGLRVPYVSVVGAGSAGLLMPNQWSMFQKLYSVPDTVDEFTGYAIAYDIFALGPPGVDENRRFRPNGTAKVRNVILPGTYNHITLPVTQSLADDPQLHAWISVYTPDAGVSAAPPESSLGLLWAADVWYSVKKHWALEAQRLVCARRALTGTAPALASFAVPVGVNGCPSGGRAGAESAH